MTESTAPIRVVVVDDDEDSFIGTRDLLRAATTPHHIDWSPSYTDGLHRLRAGGYDACLVEYRIGSHSGIELIEKAESIPNAPAMILLTGEDQPDADADALEAGATDFLIKERTDSELLSRAIRYAIRRKEAERLLIHNATHDRMTGLPNRHLFLDHLDLALHRMQRHPGGLAVMFMDIDRFKVVNDTLGHAVGDEALVEAGRRLSRSIRPHDTLARIGGDEFALLCEDIRSPKDAYTVAERLVSALQETPIELGPEEVRLTVSVGIALADQDGDATAESLLRDSDAAMYRAKQRNRGSIEIADSEMHRALEARLKLERDIEHALAAGEFELRYQPILDLTSGGVLAVEALLRWHRPDGEMVLPGDFIPLAERSGLILDLGDWVLSSASRQLAEWGDEGVEDVVMTVNVSARQLTSPGFSESLRRALREAGIPSRRLCLEISETALAVDHAQTAYALRLVKDLGVLVAVDDFGAGYGSLANLKDFPIDILKIHQSFIQGIGTSGGNEAIIKAALALAADLQLRVVAVGIETSDQLAYLRDIGCRAGQGFYLGRPALPSRLGLWRWSLTDDPDGPGGIPETHRGEDHDPVDVGTG